MKKASKRWQSLLSVFLTAMLLVQMLPAQAFAVNSETTASAEANASIAEDAVILGEIVAEREEYVKRFKMSDGTIQAVQYEVPVHYQSEDGTWAEYDKSLTEADPLTEDSLLVETSTSTDTTTTEIEETSIKEWINLSPDFAVRFSKKTTGKKLVRVEVDGHALAWCYQDANKVEGVVVESEVSDDPLVLTNVRSSVVYPGAFDNADLEYLLQPGSLKENIVLQNADAASVYTLEYKYNSLTAVQVDEHTVEFQDSDGVVVYVLYAPYMTDANGETSAALTLEITKNKKNSCTIEMAADEDWLQDETRAYPVTLDPLLVTSQAWSDEDCCQSCFISSANPDTSYGRGGTEYLGSMYAGYYSAYGKMRTLIKVATLPTIGVGDKVVHAELAAYVRYCYPINTVSAYRVTTDWTQSTATWNSNITFDSIVRDYQIVPSIERTETGVNRWETFDITELARGWYSGDYPNYGIMLRSNRESSTTGAHVQFYSSGLSNNSTVRPMLIIYYRNMTGYEDYWSYTSVAAGRDGTASVNNYNGNFTFTQPITLDAGGTLMPVSISAVYNSTAGTASYSSLGPGFQTNYHIYVAENPNLNDGSTDEEKKYKYYFNDADGTDHYFYFKNLSDTTGTDEDGLGYTLTVNSSSTSARFTITDKTGNKMIFNDQKKLVKIQNTDSITNVVAYDTNGRISTITDGAGRIYTFAYTDSTAASTIKSITDPAGRATTFTYSSGRLTRFTFPDSNCVYMSYYSTGLLYHIRGVDTTRHTFVGYEDSAAKPIDYIKIGNANDTLEKYTFAYYQNETTITDLQGRKYTCQFNNFGQMTGIVSNEDGQAQFYRYNIGNWADFRANKLLSESKIQHTNINYILNPRFTDGFDEYLSYVDSLWAFCDAIDGFGRDDNSCLATQKAYIDGSVYGYQSELLNPGVYTVSMYVSTNGEENNPVYPAIIIDVYNNGTYEQSFYPETVYINTEAGEWERRAVTFELTESRTITVYAGLYEGVYGPLYVDDIQLEKGPAETSFNLVENNGFNSGSTRWTISDGGTTSMSAMGEFTKCAYVTADPTEQNSIIQSITTSGQEGDVFSFGAWVKAHSVPTEDPTESDRHGTDPDPVFQLELIYFNGTTEVDRDIVPANSNVSTWQFISAESIADAAYDNIQISLTYDYNANTAYLTGAYCYKEQYGQTYTYDENGNIASAVDLAETESTFEYGTNNMLSKLVNPSGSSYEYTYNAKNQLTQAVSSDGQTYDFTYDSKGNVLTSTISASGASQTITTSATYTTDKNFMATLTDQRGYATSYSYNTSKGTLLTTTDPRSTVTTYAYNALNNQLTSVSAGGQTVSYTYSNDRLSTIGVNGDTTYTFTYDNFGRNTGISVGSTALATYTYTDNLLTKQTYANGATLNFAYDSLDRLTSRWYNEGDYKLEYLYGSSGMLAVILDHAANNRTKYTYDLADRVVAVETYDTTSLSGYNLLSRVNYTYADTTNYLTGVTHYSSVLGTQTIGYTYGNLANGQMPDQVYAISWNSSKYINYSYDAFGRLTSRVVRPSSTVSLSDSYTYLNGASSATTTTLVGTHTNKLGTYTYAYDANGNITSISDGTYTTTYVYDSLNQLTRENNQVEGYTYVYTYENGNILTRKKYAYTTGTLGTVQETHTWTYGDTSWGDLLTAWNDGTSSYTIASDASGNITSISNGTDSVTHTWLGRTLQSATIVEDGVTTTATYTYNAEGQRTKKVVGSTTTCFVYNGDILAGQYTGSNKLIFMYDENGSPFGFTYNGTVYYYIKNLQGDVIAITNASGTVVVEYAYDAWGKLLSVSGTAASTIGEANPIRYRGYVYDTETGYYYLNSRYYDPELCRFISADSYVSTGQGVLGYNVFAYCLNNPANYTDFKGCMPQYFGEPWEIGWEISEWLKKKVEQAAEKHYSRNSLNRVERDIDVILNTYEKQSADANKFHINTNGPQGAEAIYNEKYLSPDGGHYEVIICSPPGKEPYIVDEYIDSTNMGTYNHASNDQPYITYFFDHGGRDVFPYILFGNTREDPTGVLKWMLD